MSQEDQEAGRKRYCGVAKASTLLDLPTDENVRSYLGRDEDGLKRKSPLVNMAIRKTIEEARDLFPLLNSGLVIVARSVNVDDAAKTAHLEGASIINGAQTRGVLEDYFKENCDDKDYPSVNFELIVTDDDGLIGDISISRNFQNRVADLSIYGRQGIFDDLESSMRKFDPTIKLRKRETDFSSDFIDTEKLVQVTTALIPKQVGLPSADKRRDKTPETIYRVYAYRHRSRCLKDFASVMNAPKEWKEAHAALLDLAVDAWTLYQRLRGEQSFSPLQCVKGVTKAGHKMVLPDGVPDGIVFPMLSALSRFVEETRQGWKLRIPKNFPWETLFAQARLYETTTAKSDPQRMGKSADCYIALHGSIDMFFAVTDAAR
jgi:hypothetical protein